MRADRNRRLDPGTAERLIAGDRVEPHQLVDLLSWAAGPAHADELVGEEAATLAFRSARIHVVPAHRRRRRPARRWARLASVKAAALGLAVAVAGVAVAAGTGVLPGPQWGPAPVLTTTSTVDDRLPSTTGPSASHGTPLTSISGLCKAYLNQTKFGEDQQEDSSQPKKTKNVEKSIRRFGHAFDLLFATAGGADKAEGYCRALPVGDQPGDAQGGSSQPTTNTPATPHPSSSTPEENNQEQNTPVIPSTSRPTTHPSGPPTPPPGR